MKKFILKLFIKQFWSFFRVAFCTVYPFSSSLIMDLPPTNCSSHTAKFMKINLATHCLSFTFT